MEYNGQAVGNYGNAVAMDNNGNVVAIDNLGHGAVMDLSGNRVVVNNNGNGVVMDLSGNRVVMDNNGNGVVMDLRVNRVALDNNGNGEEMYNANQGESLADAAPPTTVVLATPTVNGHTLNPVEIQFTAIKLLGRGTFGEVVLAKLHGTGQTVAVKTVKLNSNRQNRELTLMQKIHHLNIIPLYYFYHSEDATNGDRYLHLIMECMPETLLSVLRRYRETEPLPLIYVKMFAFQLFQALVHIHSMQICHRDIKPNNILIDAERVALKLCDFGCAKQMTEGGGSEPYVCSRNYRAPELIFGSVNYTTKIDIWSAGCVLGEMLLSKLLFPGLSRELQVMALFHILGSPTKQEVAEMNPEFIHFDLLPRVPRVKWGKILRPGTPATAIDLLGKLLRYGPSSRLQASQVCNHSFFNEMRLPPPLLGPMFRQSPLLKPPVTETPGNMNVAHAHVAGPPVPGPSFYPTV